MFCNGELWENDPNLKVYQKIRRSGIQNIVAWLVILPYNEVAKWAYKNVNIEANTITNKKGNSISPMNTNNFLRIYKLLKPLAFLNKDFTETFAKEKPNPLEII